VVESVLALIAVPLDSGVKTGVTGGITGGLRGATGATGGLSGRLVRYYDFGTGASRHRLRVFDAQVVDALLSYVPLDRLCFYHVHHLKRMTYAFLAKMKTGTKK
jgi:hypothetical protein